MQRLFKLTLRTRIVIMLTLPLLGLLWFGGVAVWDKQTLLSRMDGTTALAGLAVKISAVVHEMQKERGQSAGFLSSRGAKFKNELPAQRSGQTDAAVMTLRRALEDFDVGPYGVEFATQLRHATGELERVGSIRSQVDGLSISTADMVTYYTGTIAGLLETVEHVTGLAATAEIATQSAGYVALLQAKERAGLERATLSEVFSRDTFPPGLLRRLGQLVGEQAGYLHVFLSLATVSQSTFLQEQLSGKVAEDVEGFRKIAFDKAGSGGFGVDPAVWFAASSARINRLKDVEDRLSGDLVNNAQALRDRAAQTRWSYIIVLVLMITIAAGLGGYYARDVLRTVGGEPSMVMAAMERVAAGNMTLNAMACSGCSGGGIFGASKRMVMGIRAIVHQIHLQGNTLNACVGELVEARHSLDSDAASGDQMVRQVASANALVEERIGTIRSNALSTSARMDEVAAAVGQMSDAITEMAGASRQASMAAASMAAASEQMNTNLGGVNDSLEQVNHSVSTVAAAVEEMNATIDHVRHRCEVTNRETGQAGKLAEQSLGVVQKLSDSAHEIGKVTGLIDGIAEQTNMLALNASIEAAGAGESGKGFAVVANEVKDLARQTSDATRMISEKVYEIQGHTKQAAESVQQIARMVDMLVESNEEITLAVGEQANATMEIARSMASVSQAAGEVTRNAQQLSDTAAEVARNAGESAQRSERIAFSAEESAQASRHLAENSQQVRSLSAATLEAADASLQAIIAANTHVKESLQRMSFIRGTTHHTSLLVEVIHGATDELMRASHKIQVGDEPFAAGSIKGAHLKWLGRLENVIRGRVQLKASEVTSGHECDFGKWYDSVGTQRFGTMEPFHAVGKVHMSVHEAAREVVQLANDHQQDAAEQSMERFNALRKDLFTKLDRLYLEVAGVDNTRQA
ncbi:MAG: nitrate- and nitrite sensing domain-containing protein [Magnetococcus sp. WYHC-3]